MTYNEQAVKLTAHALASDYDISFSEALKWVKREVECGNWVIDLKTGHYQPVKK